MRALIATAGVVLFSVLLVPASADAPVPAHPKDIAYPDMHYEVPPASGFRHELSNGMIVYLAEDRMLPTFDLQVIIRTGGAFDPPGKAGLASLAGEQIRDGGTQTLSPEEMDERIEFLAARLSTRVVDTRGSAGLSCLAKDVDEGLALFVDMMRYPRFDEDRLRLAKERMLQNVKRRNDRTTSIAGIEWGFLMDGDDHYSNKYPSTDSINAITQEDLFAFHREYIHPANMLLAVAGDFDSKEMLRKIEDVFKDWPAGRATVKTFPAPNHKPEPGVYLIHKDDVNQGRVSIGHKSVKRGSPDEFALRIMDGVLGRAGFMSRLFKKVRSDEGLAYSVGSRFEQGVYFAESFQCFFQSKSDSCAYATRLILDELKRLREEVVPQEELDGIVQYFVESFPQRFDSRMSLLRTYLADEYTGRDPNYWQGYVAALKKVTPEDVQRVAKKYVRPDELVILAVGDAEAILKGGHDKAPDLRLDAFGSVHRLPLRDPDTLKRN